MRRGLPALLHGDGSYLRSWLHVEDSTSAILTIMERGAQNTVYNVHGDMELPNSKYLGSWRESSESRRTRLLSRFRPGRANIRYSLDDGPLRALGWQPVREFDTELRKIALGDDFKRFL